MMLAPKQFDPVNRDLEIRDLYNMEDAFQLADGYQGAYRARLDANLAFWDGLDGKTDWPARRERHAPADRARARRLPRRRRRQALRRAGLLPRDRARRHRGPPARDLRRALAQRRRDGPDLHAARERGQRAGDPRRRRPGDEARRAHRSPTSRRRTRILPSVPSTTTEVAAPRRRDLRRERGLELDDIQSGALHERPSPYVGAYLLIRVDDRAAGRELVGRLLSVVDSGRPTADPAHDAWITAAFTYQGLKALGVPQDSLDSFAPEFRQGMAARAAELGDVGESSPANWEKPLGTADVHVALAALSPDAARLEAVLERARRTYEELRRDRGDLASGLLPAADGTHVLRLQGRDRSTRRRGQRHPRLEPRRGAAQGGRDHPRLPGRDRQPAPDADPGGARPERHLRRLPQAAHPRRRVPELSPRAGGEPRRGGAAGRQDGRPLAERRAPGALPRAGRSRARRGSAAEQRLPLRRRSARLQVSGRARTRAARTRATRSTTKAASTSVCIG